MNKLFQLTILTAALYASSSHAVIRNLANLPLRLVSLYRKNLTHPCSIQLPPYLFHPKYIKQVLIAKITKQNETEFWSFNSEAEGNKIMGLEKGPSEVEIFSQEQ